MGDGFFIQKHSLDIIFCPSIINAMHVCFQQIYGLFLTISASKPHINRPSRPTRRANFTNYTPYTKLMSNTTKKSMPPVTRKAENICLFFIYFSVFFPREKLRMSTDITLGRVGTTRAMVHAGPGKMHLSGRCEGEEAGPKVSFCTGGRSSVVYGQSSQDR